MRMESYDIINERVELQDLGRFNDGTNKTYNYVL